MVSTQNNRAVDHQIQQSTQPTNLFWILTALLTIFFVCMPFQHAILNDSTPANEAPIFVSFIIGALLLLSKSIYIWIKRESISFLPLCIWLMPLVYFISSIGAISNYNAYRQLSIWVLYAIFFVVAHHFTKYQHGPTTAYYIVIGSSSLIVLFGIVSWLGNESMWGMMPEKFYADALQLHSDGMRLTSIFQYANTYAAFLLAFIFVCLASMTLSRNKVINIISACMIVPACLSFIFTLSRGAWVMVPILFVLILPLLRFSKQIQLSSYFLLSLAVSACILPSMNKLGLNLQSNYSAMQAFKAWVILLAACIVMFILTYLSNRYVWSKLERKLEKLNQRLSANFIIPLVAIILGVAGAFALFNNTGLTGVLPDSIAHRIQNINFNQHSVLERATFYTDALKIWKDFPILGGGGGVWEALYQEYQNNPYTSSLVHSFLIETLLEVGLLGTIILLTLIFGIYYLFIRSFLRKPSTEQLFPYVWFIISSAILIHSMLDFNMSYIYIGVLVFFCLGAMLSSVQLQVAGGQKKPLLQSKWKYILPGSLIALGLWFGIANVTHLSGYHQFKITNSALTNQALQQSIEQIDSAFSKSKNPNYVNIQLQLLYQAYEQTLDEHWANKAESILHQMSKVEPYFEDLIYRQIEFNTLQENELATIDTLNQSLIKFPWEIDYYQLLAATHFRVAIAALNDNNPLDAKTHISSILTLKQEIEQKEQKLALLPEEQLSGRAFTITSSLNLAIGQAYYVLGEYEQAEAFLIQSYSGQLLKQDDIMAAIYHAAILKRLNQDSTVVTNLLYEAYPDEYNNYIAQIDTLSLVVPID